MVSEMGVKCNLRTLDEESTVVTNELPICCWLIIVGLSGILATSCFYLFLLGYEKKKEQAMQILINLIESELLKRSDLSLSA